MGDPVDISGKRITIIVSKHIDTDANIFIESYHGSLENVYIGLSCENRK